MNPILIFIIQRNFGHTFEIYFPFSFGYTSQKSSLAITCPNCTRTIIIINSNISRLINCKRISIPLTCRRICTNAMSLLYFCNQMI